MDWQYLFNIAAGIACGAGGWILKSLYDAVDALRRDVRSLETSAHERFVRRDDFQVVVDRLEAGQRDVLTKLDRIYERIDSKADRE